MPSGLIALGRTASATHPGPTCTPQPALSASSNRVSSRVAVPGCTLAALVTGLSATASVSPVCRLTHAKASTSGSASVRSGPPRAIFRWNRTPSTREQAGRRSVADAARATAKHRRARCRGGTAIRLPQYRLQAGGINRFRPIRICSCLGSIAERSAILYILGATPRLSRDLGALRLGRHPSTEVCRNYCPAHCCRSRPVTSRPAGVRGAPS